MIGTRNIRIGRGLGLRFGQIGGAAAGPPVIAGVTRDAGSRIYCPSSPAEWTGLMAAAPLVTGNPVCAWLFQEAAGGIPTDVMGGAVTLAPNAAPAFMSPVAGWARGAIRFTDGTASQRLFNNFGVPDSSLTSTLALGYFEFPAVAPAGARGLITKTATIPRVALSSTGRLQLVDGATAELSASVLGAVRPVVFQTNLSTGQSKVYTDLEKFTGTFSVPPAGAFLGLAGTTPAIAGNIAILYFALFAGAAAELTDAQVKALLTTLGWTILWS